MRGSIELVGFLLVPLKTVRKRVPSKRYAFVSPGLDGVSICEGATLCFVASPNLIRSVPVSPAFTAIELFFSSLYNLVVAQIKYA